MRVNVKKFSKIAIIVFFMWIIVFFLTSCIGYVKVVVVAPISSDLSEFGISTVNAIKMKSEEVNKSGGILGKKIRIYVVDDRGDPDTVSHDLRSILLRNNFIGVVGAPFSRIAIPVSEVCEDMKIPFITSVATNPKVTKNKEYSFRSCFTDDIQGIAAAHFVYDYLGLRIGGVFYDISDPYSSYLAGKFATEFKKLGGKIVAFYPHPQSPVTVEFPIQKMLEQKVQFVFNPDLYVDASMIYMELRKQNFVGPVIFGDGVDAPQFLARVNRPYNAFYMSHYSMDNQCWIRFYNKYNEMYKTEPNIEAYLAYDAMGLFLEAIKKANSFNKDLIKDALKNLSYDGITGRIEFKNKNDPVKPVYVYGFSNFTPVKVWEYIPDKID
ncbi:ABC transporter substrate-binding protein [Caldisericum exile]|uniref:ABC transporter substrate-binding protein n=1 Tax=Caldisericum exile (strain DSM 21853 / NBRC 104410 / AZM16c01) TaxID=511051 RepID=A0A7U6GEA4_CALEA|nr:ABC transporter substrate-binding protein [Caldisericum exile]BAL80805.1 putative ABC transporter substrate-binding protein [Caldisericum exile AZM16c01]